MKKCIILLLSVLIFIMQTSISFAETKFYELPEWKDVSSKKMWTATFNTEIKPISLSKNFYIATDENGTHKVSGIKVKSNSKDRKIVTISPPLNGWKYGKVYYLFISKNVKSKDGSVILLQDYRMKFTIEEKNIVNTLNYRYSKSKECDIGNTMSIN